MQIRSIIMLSALGAFVATSAYGCSSKKASGEPTVGDDNDGGGNGGEGGASSGCTGFDCNPSGGDGGPVTAIPCQGGCPIATCTGGGSTTISGVVYDPAGSDPVYNVQVYVPSAALPTFSQGASCQSCNALYPTSVIASAVSDTAGKFTIKNAPNGTQIPLVIQIGKWRRQFTIPTVTACVDNNAGTLLSTSLRLPSNSSEGDLPDIAVSTGGLDSLECLPLRMGVDAAEYVPGASAAGHVHIFTGGASGTQTQGAVTSPASPPSYEALWDSEHDLNVNDLVLLSCEGAPTSGLGHAGTTALMAYLNNGGRVFASHYHYAWFTNTQDPMNPFAALTPPLATWSNLDGNDILNDTVSYAETIATTTGSGAPFPEGVALETWLGNVNALDSNKKLDVYYARDNALVGAANTGSQVWASLDSSVSSSTTQYFSFDLPIGTAAGEQCGRAVYSDLHVSGGPGVEASGVTPDYQAGGGIDIVPMGCAKRALTPQEKALEFMLFDLSSCLVPIGTGTGVGIPPQ